MTFRNMSGSVIIIILPFTACVGVVRTSHIHHCYATRFFPVYSLFPLPNEYDAAHKLQIGFLPFIITGYNI